MEPKQENPDISKVGHLLGYFDAQALAPYRNEPQKYRLETDDFEGELQTTSEHYLKLSEEGQTDQVVSIRFGYRTQKNGQAALVVWLPDLFEKSKAHVRRWMGFHLDNPEWTTDHDERFDKWVRRYLEGSWDIESGPLSKLAETIRVINGLTDELVSLPLYKHEVDGGPRYPAAENSHAYQDAHRELYGYLIDGLNRECIGQLAQRLGRAVNTNNDKTIKAMLALLPSLETVTNFKPAMDLVSDQRRLAAHSVRPPATDFPAFSQYTQDLTLCSEAVGEVLNALEQDSGIDGDEAYERSRATRCLPKIVRPAERHYSIRQASDMVGKTVERVEFGFREDLKDVHGSETLLVYFTDGSIMSIDTGSNVGNLANDENNLKPEDFHVDFMIHWVPPKPQSGGLSKT